MGRRLDFCVEVMLVLTRESRTGKVPQCICIRVQGPTPVCTFCTLLLAFQPYLMLLDEILIHMFSPFEHPLLVFLHAGELFSVGVMAADH